MRMRMIMMTTEFDNLKDEMEVIWEEQAWLRFNAWLSEYCEANQVSTAVAIYRDIKKYNDPEMSIAEYARAKGLGFHRVKELEELGA